MSPVEDFAGTRAFAAQPAKFESLKHVICLGTISCLSKLWMHRGYFNKKRVHFFNAPASAVVGPAIALANSLLGNCTSIRSAAKDASLMTLEKCDVVKVEQYVNCLSDALLVCPLLCSLTVVGQPRARCALALVQSVAQSTGAHDSRSCGRGPVSLCA